MADGDDQPKLCTHKKLHLNLDCCACSFAQKCLIFQAVLNTTLMPKKGFADFSTA